MSKPVKPRNQIVAASDMVATEFLLYETEDGQTRIDVRMVGENVWLSLMQMSELFGRDKSVISRHIKNIYDEGELKREATVALFATVQNEGDREVSREIESYNLDVIISVGYRVRSLRGTQFRIWATNRLREFLIKGFTMDDERLKENGNSRYFKELLERIREIRSSEKVFWKQVLEIYATSIDYDPRSDLSQQFFATVQNKMHWAAHGHTAAEVIAVRADASQPNMGLTSWNGASPHKSDTSIAKNYLSAAELDTLNRLISIYLDFAELQASRRKPMTMMAWIQKLDDFLRTSEFDILTHAGKKTSESAIKKAHDEYDKYRKIHIDEPSRVEQHFAEAVNKVKKLVKGGKKVDGS
jgi:hypothetical protein